ncbi:DUF7689 domain-containing protein [Leeuwenhoekiella aequorea]|uniref:DUF7689 domain-containing protein n=1 Tax=Leeuwenhoekiella aequorea TaxID=283736 RepID=A0A4V1KRB1_9FLAO|nr:hypothetical protein [Leeuwenhoekiella aequorea]RXG24292.1 hypothetical protein DSM00_78 [Leeuwenhoekiella aequorea]
MLNSPEFKQIIIKKFPALKDDEGFEIIDGSNPNYNCIAWAANVKDRWFQNLPLDKRPYINFEGVVIDWPFEADDEFSIIALKQIFTHYGYIECENDYYLEGYKKVAFYELNGEATHAARQMTHGRFKGKWTSKLGSGPCIIHSHCRGISGDDYGEPVYFMKKSMS